MKTLFPPQAESCHNLTHALRTNGAALDSSDTGTGKTLKAVEIAKAMNLTPFVVCPKIVIPSWEDALEEQSVPGQALNWEKLRGGKTPHLTRKGKKSFTWNTGTPEDTLLIFDECHMAKGVKTLNAEMMIAARRQGYKVLALSATAAENPTEMKALGYVLGLHKLRDFWDWAQRFGVVFDTFGGANFPEQARHHLKKLNGLIYPERGHRMTRADLGDYFQQTRIVTEGIHFGAKVTALCKNLAQELLVLEASGVKDEVRAEERAVRERKKQAALGGEVTWVSDKPAAVTKILRLRQEIELLKVPIVATMVEEYVEAGHHVAVFLNFKDSINALGSRLKSKYVQIVGGQSAKARQDSVDRFQEDSVPVVICNTSAGGVGVSLHDTHGNHPRVSIISPTYNAKDWIQTTGRIDRLGGVTDSVQRILIALNTIEEEIVEKLMVKVDNISCLHEQYVLNTEPKTGEQNNMKEADTKEDSKTDSNGEQHHRFGPSSLKMYAACPGYKSTDGTNPAAEMGTRIHNALETGDWTPLNDYETSLAQQCSNAVQLIARREGTATGAEVVEEIRVSVDLDGGEEIFGTADLLHLKGNKAVLMDYKTGIYAVDPIDANWQARAYALGVLQKFPQVDTLTFYFIIPRRDEILRGTFSREEIPGMQESIRSVVVTAKASHGLVEAHREGRLNPTHLVCNYCAKAGECPALRDKALAITDAFRKAKPDDFEPPVEIDGEVAEDEDETSRVLRIIPIFENWIKAYKERAREMVFQEGREIPGFEVKTRSGSRKITSPVAAMGVARIHGVDVEEFLGLLDSVPVGAFEKLLSSKAKRGDKKKVVTEVMAELYELDAVTVGKDIPYISAIK